MVYRCLFEQTGTFKHEFLNLGFLSYDYDIQNSFNETDFVCDLFLEIENCFFDRPSIFDSFSSDDFILAFFPCTFFECQSRLWFSGESSCQSSWSDIDKCVLAMQRHSELNFNYERLNQLVIICLQRGFKLMIENPYTQPHYLNYYWCFKPTIIDMDRRLNGDYFKKPTQYFFFNFNPPGNVIFESLSYVPQLIHEKLQDPISRSRMHPQYARRFILKYLLDK